MNKDPNEHPNEHTDDLESVVHEEAEEEVDSYPNTEDELATPPSGAQGVVRHLLAVIVDRSARWVG